MWARPTLDNRAMQLLWRCVWRGKALFTTFRLLLTLNGWTRDPVVIRAASCSYFVFKRKCLSWIFDSQNSFLRLIILCYNKILTNQIGNSWSSLFVLGQRAAEKQRFQKHLENLTKLHFSSSRAKLGFEESLKASFLKLSKNSKGIVPLTLLWPVVVALFSFWQRAAIWRYLHRTKHKQRTCLQTDLRVFWSPT